MSNHIGTMKIRTDSGVQTVPIFDPADLDVSAWFRIETSEGTAAMRLVDISDASIEEYRSYTPDGLKGVSTSLPGEIPDSVVSRPDDDSSGSISRKLGLAFQANSEFGEIGYQLSSNVSNATRAYLYDNDAGSQLESVDVSSLSSGETFTISAAYQTNTEYLVWMDAEGSDYTFGSYSSPPYPYISTDIDITAGADEDQSGNTRTDQAYNIVSIGDVGFE